MAMKKTCAVSLLCLMLAAGCSKKSDAPSAPLADSSSTSPAAAAPAAPKADPKTLALAKPTGSGTANVDQVILAAQRAVEQNPQKIDWWIVLGRAWVRKARESSDPGFHLNASACADVVLELDPQNRLARGLRGLVLLNDHRFEEARALAEELLAKDKEDIAAYGILSDALLELGRYDEATRAAQAMLDLKPNLPSYSRASYLEWIHGDVKSARESVRLAIDSGRDRRDPEPEAWTLVQAATMFWHLGDVDGADAGFDKALEWMSAYPPALVGKGRVALARGDAKRAAELFTRAYEQSPLTETAWLLGDARELAGDADGARAAYALVAKVGRSTDPRTLSLFLSTKGKDAPRALELAEKERTTRGDVLTQDALAWALYRNGRIGDAKRVIDDARRYGTKEPQLLFHQGAIHMAVGDVDGGKKLVAEALAENPHFDIAGAREARALLDGTKLASR